MPGLSYRHHLDHFARDCRANVAVTFAIVLLPVIGAVGAAVDFSHAHSVKAAMQSALDSTALMLAREASALSDTDLNGKAKSYFSAIFTRPEAKDIAIEAAYSAGTGSQVLVKGSAKVPTAIMGIVGYNTITVDGEALAKWGSTRLRVALALDVTGSMASAGKLTALKSATKNLLQQLKAAAISNGDVYVSIIPFNKDVNVGASNYNATWIDWSSWDATNSGTGALSGTICYNGTLWEVDSSGWHNGGACSGNSGGICYNGTLWKYNGSWYNGGACTKQAWNGCVTDRGNTNSPSSEDYDRKVTAPNPSIKASLFPAEQYGSCPAPMKGLSYDWTGMDALIDSLQADGYTNQPIGLVWAWQSLVGGGPLTAPAKSSSSTYKEIIVLMSDGLNTQNRWSKSQTQVDSRMYDSKGDGTCANIKATGITIYTVHVNTDGDPMSELLKNCASGSDKFWMITQANDLTTVFTKIGTDVTKLRVAR